MSRIRSDIPIYAFTRHEATRRRVTLYRGVYAVPFDIVHPTYRSALQRDLLAAAGAGAGGDQRPGDPHQGRAVGGLRRHQLDADSAGRQVIDANRDRCCEPGRRSAWHYSRDGRAHRRREEAAGKADGRAGFARRRRARGLPGRRAQGDRRAAAARPQSVPGHRRHLRRRGGRRVLAAEAFRWQRAVAGLEQVWASFRPQVFQVDPAHMLRSGPHWLLSLLSGGLLLPPPLALFDNTPLRELLARHGLAQPAAQHRARTSAGLALCATSYSTGPRWRSSRARRIPEWVRAQRVGRRTQLTPRSRDGELGVPLLFPPVRLGREYFGDGAQRQLWPLSPAIHLGADRLLVIGVRRGAAAGVAPAADSRTRRRRASCSATCSIRCSWTRSTRLEHVQRSTSWSRRRPRARGLRHVATLVIAPSADPRDIAGRSTGAAAQPARAAARHRCPRVAGTSSPAT